jgi:hypothetical protein
MARSCFFETVVLSCALASCTESEQPASPAKPALPGASASAAKTSRQVSPALASTGAASTAPQPDADARATVHRFFEIHVVDSDTEQPIAGAKLTTVANTVYTSDDNGVIAFYEPGAMDRDVWFSVERAGYTRQPDGFGFVGFRLHALEGALARAPLTAAGVAPVVHAGDLQTRLVQQPVPGAEQCTTIRVADDRTGRGVPLVTVGLPAAEQITDSQGIVAYCDPDHWGELTVKLSSHGYLTETVMFDAQPGGSAELTMQRINIAERLYRSTGQGVYRDSLWLGLTTPVREGGLNGQVVGQDSVATAVYQERLFWLWGDTNNLSYPLGLFATAAATSQLPAAGGLDPARGVDLAYLGDQGGFIRPVAPDIAPTDKPTWLGALAAVSDDSGRERLFASYLKPERDLSARVRGLVEFDAERQVFTPAIDSYPLDRDGYPDGGQAFTFYDAQAQPYVYFRNALRIPARAEALLDPATYEVFSPFDDPAQRRLEISDGHAQYRWRKAGWGTQLVGDALRAAGLDTGQALEGHLRNIDDGGALRFSAGSVTWNEYRGRFTQIGQQDQGSTSLQGELWYAEADTPLGPWLDARKIITHNDYTFYNPYTHPYFSPDKGRTVYFEGTYTTSFSGAKTPTPLYDYNQIMYRLDLTDPRLVLPVPVYDRADPLPGAFVSKSAIAAGSNPVTASFLAPDRPAPDTVPVGWSGSACDPGRRLTTGAAVLDPVFYAVPGDREAPPASTIPLYAYVAPDGRRAYAVSGSRLGPDFVREDAPLAYVWSNPIAVALPVADFQGNLLVDAGADQCVTSSMVELRARVTRKTGNSEISYHWQLPAAAASLAGFSSQTTAAPTLSAQLPRGSHAISVDAEDRDGNIGTDRVLVTVR